ncbi:MAG: DUF928 domain-containing protein [Microcoleaceae cyanobacterium]
MNLLYKLIGNRTVQSAIAAAAIGLGMNYPVYGQSLVINHPLHPYFLLSVEFDPPGDDAPKNGSAGGTRGRTRFNGTGDGASKSSKSGATRGNVTFTPPGEPAPENSTGGGIRGETQFEPPGESTPSDSTSSGGTRNPGNLNNPISNNNKILIPLIPETNHARTISARPTIFIYMPEMSARQVFFSLQDEERNTIYQTRLEVSGQEGLVRFTLPPEAPELEIGKNYLWFFAPVKPDGVLRPDNYGVRAWIKRVEIPTGAEANSDPIAKATLYAGSGIWYDTLDILMSAKQAQPNNTALAKEWRDLLEQVGLKNIADYSLVEQL